MAAQQRPLWVDELLDLSTQEATGRFLIAAPIGDRAWLWVRDGLLTGVSAPLRRPLLARRLVTFQQLSAADVRKALESIRMQPGARLLDVLLSDRLVDEDFVIDFIRRTMAEQMSFLLHSGVVDSVFEPGRTQRQSPVLLATVEIVGQGMATTYRIPDDLARVELLASISDLPEASPVEQAFISACDGHRRPAEVGDLCGLTTAETLDLIRSLTEAGVLEQLHPRSRAAEWTETRLFPAPSPAAPVPAPPMPVPDEEVKPSGKKHKGKKHRAEEHRAEEPVPPPAAEPVKPTAPAAEPPAPPPRRSVPTIQPFAPADPLAEEPETPPPFSAPPPTNAPYRLPPPAMPRAPAAAAVSPQPGPSQGPPPLTRDLAATPTASQPAPPPAPTESDAEGRREAMSLLAVLGTAEAEAAAQPAAAPPAEPAAAPPDVSAKLWPTRLVKPADPMATGDVFRELQSLSDQPESPESPPPPRSKPKGKPDQPEKKRRFLGGR